MQIEVMNGANTYGLNGLTRNTRETMNGLTRTTLEENDIMDGLTRIALMGDDELDQTLGKLRIGKIRIRFGKGKGKAKRAEKKKIRLAAKAVKDRKKAEHKANIRKGRKKQVAQIQKFVTGIAKTLTGGGGVDEAQIREILTDEPDELPWKEREFWGLKNPVALGVYGGGGILLVGGTAWLLMRKKKRKR